MVDDLAWIAANICQVEGALLWWPSRVAVITSDAMAMRGWGAFFQEMTLTAREAHSDQKKQEPIHVLELRAVLHGLESFTPYLSSHQEECRTNNTVALAYLANGSEHDPSMNNLVRQVHDMLALVGASLFQSGLDQGLAQGGGRSGIIVGGS
jgi:hypothetical protein